MLDASQVAAALQAARHSFSHGRTAAARETCLTILRSFPEEPGALHLLGVMAHCAGDPSAAQDLLRRAAESPETKALYLLSYAELCAKAIDPAAALALTRRALTLDENLPLGWFSLGNQLLEAREYAQSKTCLERALKLDPTLWQAHARIAQVLGRLGHTEEAFECFQRLLRAQTGNAEAIGQYAAFLQDLGRYTDALIQAEQAILVSPQLLEPHLRAAEIEMHLGRLGSALERLRALEHTWPDEIALLVLEANLLRLTDRYEEAIALCREALLRGIESAELLRACALALHLAGEDGEAFKMFDRAAVTRPALALSDKGVLFTQLGKLSEACDTFDQALIHEPMLADAWYNKSNAKTYAAEDPDIGAMQRLLLAGCSHREELLLHFALGKAHMDSGNIDAAFQHWHRGNGMKRAAIEYNSEAAARQLTSIAAEQPRFDHQDRIAGVRRSEVPVFVVGMPRSGSSLLEQIVASHPDVHGAGEQTRVRGLLEQQREDDERIAATALEMLRGHAPWALRIIDKDLFNFMHLGTIHRVFPHARIVHCRRNPLDTCFSAYTKLFLGDFPFTYDLREMGLYYRSYHALMDHWRAVLPSRIFMEVDYETLVSEPGETSRRLVQFLGLPWNDACDRFFEMPRAVNTASSAAVRRPIYRSSVGRSASLISHLRPLADALGEL
jgi:tetratricopeptide (TPR) repeat protein